MILPISMFNGEKVKRREINIPKSYLKKGDNDRVLARVMPGELVVPLKYVSLVEQFLKSKKIKLRGMK